MQEYNEAAAKAGILLAAEGLTAIEKGARVKFSGDNLTVIEIRKLMDLEDFGEMLGDAFAPNEEIAKVKY